MLSDCRFDCVPLKNAEPLKVLPPERGMMLATGPPVSDSPRPPPTITCISCALPTSKANCVTLFWPNGPLTETPSTNTRPSVLMPPCAENERHAGHQRVGVDARLHDQTRRGIEHTAIVARDGQGIDGLAVDDRLATRRLRIDDAATPRRP